MAVTMLNGGSGPDVSGGSTSTVTIPSYNPSGANIGCVAFITGVLSGTPSLTSIQRNSIDGTEVIVWEIISFLYHSAAAIWYGTPALGNYTIVWTFSGNVTNYSAGAFYVAGTDGTYYVARDYNTWSSGTISNTITSEDGGMAIDAMHFQDTDSSWNVGSGQTEHYKHVGYANSWDNGAGSYEAATGSSVTMSWINILSSQWDVHMRICFLPLEIELSNYRFRHDDGDEDEATWIAPEMQIPSLDREQAFRFRHQINMVAKDPASQGYALMYNRLGDPDSEWRDVPLT